MAIYNLENYTAADGLGFPLNFRRGNPNPLDNSSVWSSLASAQEYAQTSAVSYVGQILSVVSKTGDVIETSAYIITDEAGTLAKLGSEEGVTALQTKVNTLVGTDEGKSARAIANEELAAVLLVDPETGEKNFNTLQELAAWLEDHPESVAEINAKLQDLENRLVAVEGATTKVQIGSGEVIEVADNTLNFTSSKNGVIQVEGQDLEIYKLEAEDKTIVLTHNNDKTVSDKIKVQIASIENQAIEVKESGLFVSNQADSIKIKDTSGKYTANNVEDALQEILEKIDDAGGTAGTAIQNLTSEEDSITINREGNNIDLGIRISSKEGNSLSLDAENGGLYVAVPTIEVPEYTITKVADENTSTTHYYLTKDGVQITSEKIPVINYKGYTTKTASTSISNKNEIQVNILPITEDGFNSSLKAKLITAIRTFEDDTPEGKEDLPNGAVEVSYLDGTTKTKKVCEIATDTEVTDMLNSIFNSAPAVE